MVSLINIFIQTSINKISRLYVVITEEKEAMKFERKLNGRFGRVERRRGEGNAIIYFN